MKFRTTGNSQFDHRLDALEARSLFSAAPIDVPQPGAHAPAAVIADESFLIAGSDAAPQSANSASDADMYVFNAGQNHAALGETVYVDNGEFDADPGHPGMWNTPSDVSTTVPGYGESAPYSGDVNVTIDEPIGPSEEQVVPADAPVAAAPVVAPVEPAPAVSMSVAPVSEAPAIVWLETPSILGKSAKDKAATEQVVIVSNFVAN